MAKLHGGGRTWQRNTRTMFSELMRGEILADSIQQKLLRETLTPEELKIKISKILGIFRRCLAKEGWEQKTLSRWVTPAPRYRVLKGVRVRPCDQNQKGVDH